MFEHRAVSGTKAMLLAGLFADGNFFQLLGASAFWHCDHVGHKQEEHRTRASEDLQRDTSLDWNRVAQCI
jgi:hypothetical protein